MSFLTVVQGSAADFHRTLGHPGSWPANWVFAWKYGVSPGRFDDLFGRLPRHSWGLKIGSPEDAAVLGRGWSRVEEGESGRWAEGEDATLLFTLTDPVDRRLRLRGAAARDPGARTQSVSVEVNGEAAGSLSLTPDGRSWETRGRPRPVAAGPQRDPLPRGVAPLEEGGLGRQSATVRRLEARGDRGRARALSPRRAVG